MFEVQELHTEDKKSFYELVLKQLEALIEGENDTIANLANASALLNQVLDRINWVGFYLMKGDELVLGPFQGKVACVRIKIGRGVCGTAVAEDQTQVVKDVHAFPGHIACDSASNSEVVIPMHGKGRIVGVLDIDSPIKERFDEVDAYYLERVVKILEEKCTW
ncbi:MAG: GAF domain-containing protein [Cellulosilyticaceae bacterium]